MADTSTSETFKAPLSESSSNTSCSDSDSTQVERNASKNKSSKPQVNVPLPYTEPEWRGTPPPNFRFEIIKNGTFISTLEVKLSVIVFGRLEVCDAVFEHPSVSRYHAIVQYCAGDDSHPKGFYLYDLGSTHGTFLNKEQIKPRIYYKLKVGYILKFGGSSRLYLFQGPETEEDTGTKEPVKKDKVATEVCTWGMGEDAEEEEEGTINPFALSTPNEELYLDDPKKTLRGWFEREGYEVEYNVEEKGFKTFSCNVRLPIDTPSGDFLPVEASVSGKKKEAVVACALEACRTLDRLGLLRQSHHESRQRKKKKWEENDYYDSDEDTFYDRTGEIEKRREMRKRLAKKVEVENFQTLETKLAILNSEIDETKRKLDTCAAINAQSDESKDDDSLEMYMSSLAKSSDVPKDKFERRKLMLRLAAAEKEKAHLEKLLDIARPAKLPPIAKYPGMIGKRPKSKLQISSVKPKHTVKTQEEPEPEIEVESDTEDVKQEIVTEIKTNLSTECKTDDKSGKYGLILDVKNQNESKVEKVSCIEVSPDSNLASSTISVPESSNDPVGEQSTEKNNSDQTELPIKPVKKHSHKKLKKDVDVYKTDNAEYCTWTPPANQSGDGVTHLNAKYGY